MTGEAVDPIPDASRFELDLDRALELLPRYNTAGPRYTSYPTAPVWKDDYGPEAFRADLGREVERKGLALYAHVPFCRSLCHFCACNRVITHKPELPENYLDAIEREIASLREAIPEPPAATQQHWGGGTPTHLDPDQIRRLYRAIVDAFPMAPGAEISVEVDPRVTTTAHLEALRACGFGRISMGVQDFEDEVQQAIHRIQPASETSDLVDRSRALGFESVNLDLIYGLPYQSEASFGRTLDQVFAIAPDRLALYSYAHVTWVAKQQRGFERKHLPEPEQKLRIMLLAIRRFLEEGYVYIGMDHFARPDDELAVALREGTLRRNFMGYTTQAGTDLIGFGPSAISELSGCYAQSLRDLGSWQEAAGSGVLATARGHRLSDDDRARRWVISRLMCLGELRAEDYRKAFGETFGESFAREIESLRIPAEDGLVAIDGDGSLKLSALGRVLVRNVAAAFDAYLPVQMRSGESLFSKTV